LLLLNVVAVLIVSTDRSIVTPNIASSTQHWQFLSQKQNAPVSRHGIRNFDCQDKTDKQVYNSYTKKK